jgi:PAS domain S-box-containing protein
MVCLARAEPSVDGGYVFDTWGTDDGLPQATVKAIVQTRDGYLWVGTFGGLARFDGVKFTVLDAASAPGLRSHRILTLYEARDGVLWIGTEGGGLTSYAGGKFTSYTTSHGLPSDTVGALTQDARGDLWVTTSGGLARWDGTRFTAYTEADGLPAGPIWRMDADKEGRVWIGTSGGLALYEEGRFKLYTTADGLPSDEVRATLVAEDGAVWAATSAGLARLKDGSLTAYTRRDGLLGDVMRVLAEDAAGNVWTSALSGGLNRWSGGELTAVTGGGLANTSVMALAPDREGNLWVGTSTHGLVRIKPRKVTAYGPRDGVPDGGVVTIVEDAEGTIWMGGMCAGLVRFRDGEFTTTPTAEGGLPKSCVWSLLAARDGSLWVGTWGGGVVRYKDGASTAYTMANSGLSSDAALALYEDRAGTLWVGTERGLNRLQDGRFTVIREADGLVHDDVRLVTETSEGELVVGTMGGLSVYKDGAFTNYTAENGLPNANVRDVYEAPDGALWIGTYGGGLARLKDGKLVTCSTHDGLYDDTVSRILDDGRGYLWLSGNKGISRVSSSELNDFADGRIASVAPITYGPGDGMLSRECNGGAQPAGWRARDGRLWFPTMAGPVVIDPARAVSNTLAPHVLVEEVLAGRTSFAPWAIVELPPGRGNLEIRYTALSLSAPEKVRFKYRLEGYDEDWVDAGSRRVAYYTNIGPGRYRFRVIAANDDGVWNEGGAALELRLAPRFYQTVWFAGLCALAVGALGLVLVRLRVRHLVRRTAELEAKVAERTSEIVEQRNKLSEANEELEVANEQLADVNLRLERANDEMLAIFDQLRLGVAIVERDGSVAFLSQAARRMLGRGSGDALGRPWEQVFPLREEDRATLRVVASQPRDRRSKLPVHMDTGDGRRFWMEVEVQDDPRDAGRRIFVFYDMSEVYDLRRLLDQQAQFEGMVGQSRGMRTVYKHIQDVARVDTTVLIEGETGTGKELVARAIHYSSARKNRPFVAVNSAGLTESLLASQLFGHRRGAFTGATADQVGVFEAASGGTLFLDEIGDIPPSVQMSLLRVLQEKEITRLGESTPRKIDVRVIAATHHDLGRSVATGSFRQDLLYRIRVARIHLPPLRERREDIPALAGWFLDSSREATGKPVKEISAGAMRRLMEHEWPGNVRELKSAIEYAVIRCEGELIQPEDLPPEVQRVVRVEAAKAASTDERAQVLDALLRAKGNRTEAARLLGVSRATFYRRLATLSIDRDD